MKEVMRKLWGVFPRLKRSYYTIWNRLYFSIMGVQYGKNMIIRNKVYITNMGG